MKNTIVSTKHVADVLARGLPRFQSEDFYNLARISDLDSGHLPAYQLGYVTSLLCAVLNGETSKADVRARLRESNFFVESGLLNSGSSK